jgi:hypothetical protein
MRTEGTHPAEFLLSEAPGSLSRDNVTVTVPASTTLPAGSVLGQITATGKYVQYDETNSDGSQNAAAVLVAPLQNDEVAPADAAGVVINLNAEVRVDDLQWKDGVDDDGGVADLRALGIKARA